MTKVIALTGGIGSGKTTVSNILKKQHIPIIDTDIIARKVVEPGSFGLVKIKELFGNDYLNTDGSLNRPLLRSKIFNDPEAKQNLEQILHPLIQEETLKQLENHKQQRPPYIVIAIPLLIETIKNKNTRPDYIDEIWVVDCPVEQQIERATNRDQSDSDLIKKIIAQQASREERLCYANKVINNNGSLEALEKQIQTLLTD